MGTLPKNQEIFLKILIYTNLVFVSFISLFPPKETKNEIKPLSVANTPKAKIIYTSLYSDKNITTTAKETNSKFKNITFVNRNILLANAIGSYSNNTTKTEKTTKENGSWLWTPISRITPTYSEKIISGAKENGINVIYLSIDSYLDIFTLPDGKDKDEKQKVFDETIEKFIDLSHRNGIQIDAEAGWRNWAETGNTYKAYAVLDYVLKFNKNHKEKFRGFQYDVEPYLLDEYQSNKTSTLKNFLNLIDQSLVMLNNTDIELSVVIPDFYDGISGETPEILYKGKTLSVLEHLYNILDLRNNSQIIVMSYRNHSLGNDGTIDISANEVAEANKHNTKVIIAQETGDVIPPHITFYKTSKEYYENQLQFIWKAFSNEKGFGGVATHYINSLLEL